jgi:(p)ppGpp synthase/HD superfamily hydrolase
VARAHRIPSFVSGLPRTRAAIAYAEERHAGQCRADGSPFILHPLEVASILYYAGAPDHLVAAGLLHDVMEKAGVGEGELERLFGGRDRELVVAVSDDDRITRYAARKAALRLQVAVAGDEALMLFAADKLSKLRELRRETESDDDRSAASRRVRAMRARRLRHYQRSLALLEERLRNCSLVRELRDELRAFVAHRPVPALAR